MLSFTEFSNKNKINFSPEEEEQIIKMYHEGIKKARTSNERFDIHSFSDKIGVNHQTLRRRLLTRGKFNEVTNRIKEKDPSFEPEELRFGAGKPKKTPEHFASPQMYKILKKQYDAGETSINQIKQKFSTNQNAIKYHLGIK